MSTRREFLSHTAGASALAVAALRGVASAAEHPEATPPAPMRTYAVHGGDLKMSRLGYGLAMLGWDWRAADFVDKTADAIRIAYENGITLFDTADIYAHGRAEQALGKVLRDSPQLRNEFVIQTKCGIRLVDPWTQRPSLEPQMFSYDLSRQHIVAAAEASLVRLGIEQIDILLLHVPDPLMEPEEVAGALDALSVSGKVRHFGVSNFGAMHIALLQKYVRQPLLINQIHLGLGNISAMIDDTGLGGLLNYCRLQEIQIQAHSPLKGRGQSRPTLLDPPADAADAVRRAAGALAEIAHRHQTTPPALMLAWLLHHPAGILPIIGATKPEHIVQNCRADGIKLERDEWCTLTNAAAAV